MNPQLEGLKFDSNGLIPAIIQDHATGEVLMFAFMNAISIAKTVETGMCHYYSRSRQKLWLKGETSGHLQTVKSIRTDCDKDVVLISIDQVGVACHDGYRSCFYREYQNDQSDWKIVGSKLVDPDQVYKNK